MKKVLYHKFRVHYEEFLDPIFNYVYYRVNKNRNVAEDLVSEIFLKAFENFEHYNEKTASFRSWIYAITKHHLIDFYRVSRPEVSLDEIKDMIGETQDYEAKLDQKYLAKSVEEKLKDLPKSYREIIELKYYKELSNEEIGREIKKEPGTVRVTIHRALNALRKKIH